MENAVNLAMPFGLPEPEDNILSHYQALAEQTTIETEDNTVQIFTTDAPEWSSVHTMCRCIAEVLPAETTAPDGSILSQPAILIKPWFWDFLQMAESNNSGGLLPSKIVYKNIDEASIRSDIEEEFETNERYSEVEDKETLLNEFIHGEVKLLLQSEIKIGMGILDDSGEHSGKRCFELQFFDYDNNLIDPEEVSNIFSLVGGRTVNDHPFIKTFSSSVWPTIVPIEGGLRFKISGLPFLEDTQVTVGNIPVSNSEIRLSPTGEILYGTFPSGTSSGPVDVTVRIPGRTPTTFSNAITYKEGILDTLRAAIISYSIYLNEVKSLINEEKTRDQLTLERIEEWQLNLHTAREIINHVIFQRSENSQENLRIPEASQIWENAVPLIRSLSSDVLNMLRG